MSAVRRNIESAPSFSGEQSGFCCTDVVHFWSESALDSISNFYHRFLVLQTIIDDGYLVALGELHKITRD